MCPLHLHTGADNILLLHTITDMAVDFKNQHKPYHVSKSWEGGVLCHPLKKNGTGTAQLQGVHQNYQASHSATLLHNNSKG